MMAIGNKRTRQGYLAGACALALAGCATTMAEPAPTPAASAPQASADIGTFFERYDQAQLALSRCRSEGSTWSYWSLTRALTRGNRDTV